MAVWSLHHGYVKATAAGDGPPMASRRASALKLITCGDPRGVRGEEWRQTGTPLMGWGAETSQRTASRAQKAMRWWGPPQPPMSSPQAAPPGWTGKLCEDRGEINDVSNASWNGHTRMGGGIEQGQRTAHRQRGDMVSTEGSRPGLLGRPPPRPCGGAVGRAGELEGAVHIGGHPPEVQAVVFGGGGHRPLCGRKGSGALSLENTMASLCRRGLPPRATREIPHNQETTAAMLGSAKPKFVGEVPGGVARWAQDSTLSLGGVGEETFKSASSPCSPPKLPHTFVRTPREIRHSRRVPAVGEHQLRGTVRRLRGGRPWGPNWLRLCVG